MLKQLYASRRTIRNVQSDLQLEIVQTVYHRVRFNATMQRRHLRNDVSKTLTRSIFVSRIMCQPLRV